MTIAIPTPKRRSANAVKVPATDIFLIGPEVTVTETQINTLETTVHEWMSHLWEVAPIGLASLEVAALGLEPLVETKVDNGVSGNDETSESVGAFVTKISDASVGADVGLVILGVDEILTYLDDEREVLVDDTVSLEELLETEELSPVLWLDEAEVNDVGVGEDCDGDEVVEDDEEEEVEEGVEVELSVDVVL
ncbi:hypothetical protein AAF712_005323 [Marasmius tenuissimus]|uniref:Uncharacterized protein n=1 Tax=Marasmius tenuissimus TaxID=585030 RepID=A0ABR3A3L4_9AGAR